MKKMIKMTGKFLKRYLTIIIIAFIFLFLFVCDNSTFRVGNLIIDNLKSIATSFTPTTDLFDDGSEVSFVSYFFGMKFVKSNTSYDVEFSLPTSSQNLSNSDEYFLYDYIGIICSVADGKVSDLGYTKDGKKYISILHNNGTTSKYIGVTQVGVTLGQNVFSKRPIAMTSGEVEVLLYDGEEIVNLSEIEWKN